METFDTLCQIQSYPIGCLARFIGEGLTPSAPYALYYASAAFPGNPAADTAMGVSAVADADGVVRIGLGTALAIVNRTYWLHDGSGGRVANGWDVVFTSPAAACQVYVTDPVLTATAHAGYVGLNWTAASPCDGRGQVLYEVRHGTSSPPGATQASGLTGTTYSDSFVMPGVLYYFRVRATWLFGTGATVYQSNIASATATATVAPSAIDLSGIRFRVGTPGPPAGGGPPDGSISVDEVRFRL